MFGINKIFDTYGIAPGGRVDQYWHTVHPDVIRMIGERKPEQHRALYDPNETIKTFNLRGIEFGNWMSQQDRANHLYGAAMTMFDTANVFNIPFRSVGLKKQLTVSLGARGFGGRAAAHFEPITMAVNMTKTSGKGSFVHEWGHAVDRVLGAKFKMVYASGGRSTRKKVDSEVLKKRIPGLTDMEVLFMNFYFDEGGLASDFQKKLIKTESEYLNRRTEVWARTCEQAFELLSTGIGIRNKYAVDYMTESDAGAPPKVIVKKNMNLILKIIKAATL